tara:strand:- start:4904 stop:5908 length:1005 start_codon:yes stop_codon:yes gene_type:complete
MFDGKDILITGGTGSFGKALTELLLNNFKPNRIVIYSRDELKQLEMSESFCTSDRLKLRFFIGDVRDSKRLRRAMNGIDYVIHAAALKHVPVAEYNPMECVKTNILGASNVIEEAIDAGVKYVMALSTDKATHPVNLYGASKLASDKLFVAANNVVGHQVTRFSVVRYGNVLGSRGSVVSVYKKQLKEGRLNLPLTDPRMTRFWITLEQGANFVLKCFHRMYGGETFIPKIPSMKMVDIISAMSPNGKPVMIGRRPGEKLHEVMCPADVCHRVLEYPEYYVIKPSIRYTDVDVDYMESRLGEIGEPVKEGFEYNSYENIDWLSKEDFLKLIENI